MAVGGCALWMTLKLVAAHGNAGACTGEDCGIVLRNFAFETHRESFDSAKTETDDDNGDIIAALQQRRVTHDADANVGTFESARPTSCCTTAPESTVMWSEFEATLEFSNNLSGSIPIVIPCGVEVVVDKISSPSLPGLQVQGALRFQDGIDVQMTVDHIFVCGNFSIGSSSHAHESIIDIVLVGSTDVTWPSPAGATLNFGHAGFITYGGSTYIRGKSCGTPSWTSLTGFGPIDRNDTTETMALTTNATFDMSSQAHWRTTANKAADGGFNKWTRAATQREQDPWWQARITQTSQVAVGLVTVYPTTWKSLGEKMFTGGGVVVGVSETPCEGKTCGGHVCATVTTGYSSKIEVDCNGTKGTYVYLQARGSNIWIDLYEVEILNAKEMHSGETSRSTMSVQTHKPLAWSSGDSLLITSSSFDARETEVVTCAGVEGRQVSILGVPTYDHESCDRDVDPSCLIASEVASLSRNIRIRGADTCKPDCGHVMVAHTNHGFICGVEFTNLGQTGVEGRYPLHFHLPGWSAELVAKDNAVHNNHNRGIVIHGAHAMTVESNVCYKTKGHCIMLEDGVEQHNVIKGNLAAMVEPMSFKCIGFRDFNCADRSDHSPNAFWIPNPNNIYIGNVGINWAGAAFFIETRHVTGKTRTLFLAEAMKIGSNGKIKGRVPFGKFQNNQAHSTSFGWGNYPRMNVNYGDGYEDFKFWRCGLGMQIHNNFVLPVVRARFLENNVAFSGGSADARIALRDSQATSSGRWGSYPFIIKKLGLTSVDAMDKVFGGIDDATLNWIRCHGKYDPRCWSYRGRPCKDLFRMFKDGSQFSDRFESCEMQATR
eukprot:TRINITY_DN5148_c0_g1_i1.p1 TRINITY_DN5148_c0_g1~~TRINITY_DN5148_c0_g1_i1.p1  ORF type:complete len:858 (+),score=126.42 TRINITY_DN5148_c0_g1_i1:85-2574(+)